MNEGIARVALSRGKVNAINEINFSSSVFAGSMELMKLCWGRRRRPF
jgi:hypothetical protein